jgi:Ni/Co efflux regulator RcnB
MPILLVLFVGLTGQFGRSAPAPLSLSGGAGAARDDQRHENDAKFNDHDRQAAHDYANQHKNERGFRDEDRLSPENESKLREGYVMDKDMRRMSRPAPPEMIRGMAPAPRGYRYVVVGGHVCLIDSDYRIHDTIHLELNLGL